MNLRWRESVKYFRSYASSKGSVGEIRKKDREREREIDRNKHYESRMLMPFGINLNIYMANIIIMVLKMGVKRPLNPSWCVHHCV